MTEILQKNISSAAIFLVQIRITWREFSKKSFPFVAFHLCGLQIRQRKELPRQTLPQKYKDIYLLGSTKIQKSRRQNWDSEVHPNLLCSFLLGTLSSRHMRPQPAILILPSFLVQLQLLLFFTVLFISSFFHSPHSAGKAVVPIFPSEWPSSFLQSIPMELK